MPSLSDRDREWTGTVVVILHSSSGPNSDRTNENSVKAEFALRFKSTFSFFHGNYSSAFVLLNRITRIKLLRKRNIRKPFRQRFQEGDGKQGGATGNRCWRVLFWTIPFRSRELEMQKAHSNRKRICDMYRVFHKSLP